MLTSSSGLANAGTIRLESSEAVAASNLVLSSGTLLNTGLIDVRRGSGGGRSLIANLDNRGTLAVGVTARLTKTSNGVFNNSGAMTLTATDTLEVAVGAFTLQPGGTFTGGGMLMLDRVTLAGAGTLGALVEAYESAVNPAGILRIEGSYYQDSFTQVNIDLGGAEPGTGYDRLEVGGEAYMDGGNLSLHLVNGYEPGNCTPFTVLSYGSLGRRFEDIDDSGVDLDGDLQLHSVYTDEALDLLVSDEGDPVNVVPTQLNLTEGGGSQSYRVCLGREPNDEVEVSVSPDAQVRVAPTELVFAEAAWNAVHSVAVTAVDDAANEGTHNGIVSHDAESQDDDFDEDQVSRVIAQIADNDGGGSSLSVNDVSVAEGNSGTRNLTFTVTLSPASSQTVSVAWATANGTATAGSDYNANSGTLSFSAGQTSRTVAVTVRGDQTVEPDETFFLNLSNATNATLADPQGIGTITNDDGTSLSVGDAAVAEGNSGTRNLTFTVTLSPASSQAVSVAWATANGTAIAPGDYAAASGTLNFAAGETSKTVAITINGDLVTESDETFTLNLSNPSNATIADGQGQGTITNDDAAPSLSVGDAATTEGNSGTKTLSLAVTLSNPSSQAVSVAWATANGTAIAPGDYAAASGTLNFAVGETSKTVAISINGDLTTEPDETFTLNLSNPTNATLGDGQGVGTITNDDVQASLSINDVAVAEGNSGTRNLTFTVTLAPASTQTVSVAWATANGTATAGSDYAAASGTLSFSPGQTSRTIEVAVNGDLINEGDENLVVNLSGATNAILADNQGQGTITDDDNQPTISINDAAVSEGNSGTSTLSFTVTLSNPSSVAITVQYATANGTATSGSDYTAASGTLTIAAGQTSGTVAVTVNGDVLNEADETFTLTLSGPTNATLADAQGTGTIANDDTGLTISISDASVSEGNSGTKSMTFTVSLSAASGRAVNVTYTTANGTATAGSDYTAASSNLVFTPGVTSRTVEITINGDLTTEADETFTVNLSSPTNVTIADGQGVGTITNDDAQASLSINDVAVVEGNSGTRNLTFTVTLAPASTQTVSVAYATANGTAISGSDYTATSGTLTFAAGETSKSVGVTVAGDVLSEDDETFALNLSAPTNATISDAQGVGTLTNDDTGPTISIGDAAVAEGNSGTKTLSFTVSLSVASGRAVNVTYTTANGTATAGVDYVADTRNLVFTPGVTSRTVEITLNGDLLNEADETFFVNLSSPTNVTIADGQGVGTISNDDPVPSLAISDAALTEGNAGSTVLTFTVTLSPAGGQAATVSYATANGTATAGSDYTAATGTLSFAAGETSKSVAVTVAGDALNEANETFTLNLSTPVNATLGDATGTGTITNDDPVPTLAVNDVSVTEGNSGTSSLSFTVTLSAASGQGVTVAYATANGTATAGSDYTAASGTLTFAAGETSKSVAVTVAGDLITEPDETLTLNLSAPTNATIGDAQGVGTISNDDAPPTIAVNDVSVTEGNSVTSSLSFAVTLSNPSSAAITVQYATANGTATAGGDYTAVTGTLTFAAGETSKSVAVTVAGDALNEANETFTLNLSAPVNATLGDATGTGTITNDDPVPTIAVNDVSVTEGNSGTSSLSFTVTLSAASGQGVTVSYATANGTATAGSDYTAATGTLSFAAGETSKSVAVTVAGDALNEANETFTLTLSAPTNATISDAQGVGTITNDDPVPSLSVNDASATEGNSGTSSLSFTVTLSAASGQTVTVAYATANGTATSGSDYTAASGTLTFAAGETSKSVAVTVAGDALNEANETFTLSLSTPTNATIGDATGTGTISNDDPVSSLAVGDATTSEGTAGTTTTLAFTITLTPASGQEVSVAYATTNGTATSGGDYTAATGTLSFAAGETSKRVAVSVTGDLTTEPDETLTLTLSTPTNATISDAQGNGTISNDDAPPTIAVNDVSITEGNSGTGTLSFEVTLSNPSSAAITVQYVTANGTATAGSDYTAATGTLSFAEGETSKTVPVTITGEELNEVEETFTLNLSAATNATIGDATGIGTITNDDPVPALAVNDVSVTEGNSGTSNLSFAVTLSAASGQAVTVAYATANGTATAGSDYTAASGTLSFAAGETSKTVAVTVAGDVLNEVNETFTLNLSAPVNATISDAQGIGTISNDDPVPSLAVNDVSATEGNSGTSNLSFAVTLSAASGQVVTVAYATANGTATSGSDYTAATGTLSFAAGETSKTIPVTIAGDALNEPDETLNLNLSTPANATIGDALGIGTISNDDPVPTLAVNDVSATEGNSGISSLSFTVTLSAASGQAVTVAYATANGTATAGSDYTAATGTLSFAAGETSKSVAVTVAGDVLNEANETFTLNLSAPTNATLADAQGIGTLTNDDTAPSLVVNDVSVTEGNSGTSTLSFTVSLSAASGQTVSAAYATANGTATSGTDYTAATGTLTIAAGQTSGTVAVTINGDALNEANETFTLGLSGATNATLVDGEGTGTITNDDPVPSLVVNDVSVTEGNSGTSTLSFTVSLSAASGQVVTVAYGTANGTATSGSDYTAASGTLNFAAGETSKTVAVSVTGDLLNEANETFTLTLSAATSATISDAEGIGTITNDDAAPIIAVNDVSVTEGNGGTATMTFTVSLSSASSVPVTVAYATANGTATAGTDYTAASSTLTFAAGETSKTVAVNGTGDGLYEANETILFNLSNPTNATLGDNQGIGTLTNDDTAPTLTVDDVTLSEGNSGTSTMTFTIRLSAVSGLAANVNYATTNGTATAGSDYVADSRNVVLTPGESTRTVAITVNGDLLNEADETFTLDLSTPNNATIADGQGVGRINNDDAAPTISVNDVTVTEGNSGTTAMNFAVSLSAASGQTVTVQYDTANGTATAGSDYTAVSGTLTIAAGQTSATVAVAVTGDLIFEPTETMTINLSNATNGSTADPQGIGTITNDDTTPTIAVNDVSVNEGNSGTTTLNFTVSLSNPSSSTITVQYATANGTATSGSDYTATNNTLTFVAGETSKTVAVSITGDARNEANETFNLNLSNAVNATIADTQGIGTITNDDPQPSLSVNDVSISEGNTGTKTLNFTVTLSAASNQTVTVNYATANGTASSSTDYTAASGTLTYTAGQTSKAVGVTIRGDRTSEPNETFTLNLSSAANATLADAQGIGTITNDDGSAKVVADGLIGEGRFGVANYPNPFNPSTQVVYSLTEEAPVRLVVYNALGQQIRVLVEGLQLPGSYEVPWDGRDEAGQPVGAGWYLYRLEAGAQVGVGRMSLVK